MNEESVLMTAKMLGVTYNLDSGATFKGKPMFLVSAPDGRTSASVNLLAATLSCLLHMRSIDLDDDYILAQPIIDAYFKKEQGTR